jgi:hypothetical protein
MGAALVEVAHRRLEFCSHQIGLSPLANVVDANYSAVAKVPQKFLPAADAYGGMHRHPREQAASL